MITVRKKMFGIMPTGLQPPDGATPVVAWLF
jgi:hypothetical protein